MNTRIPASFALLALAAGAPLSMQAQFAPINLAPTSYVQDVVVERAAPHPFTPATTASIDGGTNNTGFTYYEAGYNFDSPETGVPIAGSTFMAQDLPDHSYQMAANYKASNALLIDRAATNGTLTLTAPAALSAISLLTASGNSAVTLNYTLRFTDQTTETGTVTSPDWFGGSPTAVNASGRVNASSGAYQNVGSADPRLYAIDIPIAASGKTLQSIEFTFGTGAANAHTAIFAVSGSAGGEFTPLAVTGFNQDMIVESDATHPAPLFVTDATLDAGINNTGATFYEQGYNLTAPATGIPAAGTTLTNAAGDHVYRMASSYTAANAVVIDTLTPGATLTLATPAAHSALSILGSSGNGAVTLNYEITHTDSAVQTGTVVVPDWYNGVPYILLTQGRVNVENGGLESVNSDNPRLYGIDIAVERTTTPIASVTLTHAEGNGHATIFALSGTAGAVKPIFDVQPRTASAIENTAAQLTATVSGTAPISFQWQREVNGSYVNVANGGTVSGANTATLDLSSASLTNAGNYILIAQNSAGASTSLVTRLNVYSSKADVTSPSDTITSVGGNSPELEPVTNAIDDTTSKYLNYGSDGDQNNPFTGPAGLVVTPAMGSTVVTGLRIYTANDAGDRDPADYTLEGSNDGTTFNVISSGALALPGARNEGALELDPLQRAVYEVNFANTAGYTTYRMTFNNVKNNATVNSMQIGEIELLGTAGTGTPVGPTLTVTRDGTANITISWAGGGTLQATPSLDNPQWTTVAGSSPVTVPATGNYRFFRVVR